jgi:hypothetical protein
MLARPRRCCLSHLRSSISCRLTQSVSDCAERPILPTVDSVATHCELRSWRCHAPCERFGRVPLENKCVSSHLHLVKDCSFGKTSGRLISISQVERRLVRQSRWPIDPRESTQPRRLFANIRTAKTANRHRRISAHLSHLMIAPTESRHRVACSSQLQRNFQIVCIRRGT